jgi:hypothetical protein
VKLIFWHSLAFFNVIFGAKIQIWIPERIPFQCQFLFCFYKSKLPPFSLVKPRHCGRSSESSVPVWGEIDVWTLTCVFWMPIPISFYFYNYPHSLLIPVTLKAVKQMSKNRLLSLTFNSYTRLKVFSSRPFVTLSWILNKMSLKRGECSCRLEAVLPNLTTLYTWLGKLSSSVHACGAYIYFPDHRADKNM